MLLTSFGTINKRGIIPCGLHPDLDIWFKGKRWGKRKHYRMLIETSREELMRIIIYQYTDCIAHPDIRINIKTWSEE